MTIPDSLRIWVRDRARNRCEYCQLHQTDSLASLHIEHITPKKHGDRAEGSRQREKDVMVRERRQIFSAGLECLESAVEPSHPAS